MDESIMVAVGLLAVTVLAILGFRTLAQGGRKIAAERAALLARSRRAHARVLQLGKSVPQVRNGTVIVKIRLEVQLPDEPAYEVTTVWEVQLAGLAQLQSGCTLTVKVDPDDAYLIYPAADWAQFSDLYWNAWVRDKRRQRRA